MVQRKRTNNDLQNTMQKTVDQATRPKTDGEHRCSGRVSSTSSTNGTVVLL